MHSRRTFAGLAIVSCLALVACSNPLTGGERVTVSEENASVVVPEHWDARVVEDPTGIALTSLYVEGELALSISGSAEPQEPCMEGVQQHLIASEPIDVGAGTEPLALTTWRVPQFVPSELIVLAVLPQADVDAGCFSFITFEANGQWIRAGSPYRTENTSDLWLIGGRYETVDDILASAEYTTALEVLRSLEVAPQ